MVTAAASSATTHGAAWAAAAQTPDPELPMLTLADLGILRDVQELEDRVVATITPTYSGCPAMREIGLDVRRRLEAAGYENVQVATQLAPAWTSDWITEEGRGKLRAAGIAPPGAAWTGTGPVPVTLGLPTSAPCPHCGSASTSHTAAFGATACRSLHRCHTCGEPFEAVKAI
ncbi:1,2-phenylacetyl-CoA epoxidase subunit PaaD [Allobranchiibius sp. CTAmp26]|uniref:1,2-phenylacetyl-CoA epoxidase subunit PaaD n=1 Tax=Allobranchiibius sp. CTAmp26 TaxID=2815214 RepID=UPI001AA15DEC|nr:1,2-phenylacetyl-CoA epoxidase subunit PaaD [Allobranchiibius sp. CTAmp26]MBO1755846.1 phenylacetate-CoA oxygenase subunit PaaJ [Allobranchiibius sp. CTAmp26]